jgi:hypothetical protein
VTFICDNLAISGSHFRVMHKNTMNGWENFRRDCLFQASESTPLAAYYEAKKQLGDWSGIELSEREGYRILGELQGYDRLTPHQASVAFQDWHTPRHEAFAARNLRSLYQCVTEGLKKGPIATLPERHIAAHQHLRTIEIQG